MYYMMNFNDYTSALVTMFHLIVVNNWMNTTNMLIDVSGGSQWPKAFVYSFIILTTWMMLTIVISFILEIHD